MRKERDLKCVVGLFGYSTPAILGAMKEAGVTGKVKVVGGVYDLATGAVTLV